MKTLKKIILIVGLLAVIFFVTITVYLRFYARALLEQALCDQLNKNVQVGALFYQFPFGIHAYHVKIEDMAHLKEVVVQLSPSSIWMNQIRISSVKVIAPSVTIRPQKSLAAEEPKDVPSEQPGDQVRVTSPTNNQLSGGEEIEQSSSVGVDAQKTWAQESGEVSSVEVVVKQFLVRNGRFEYSNENLKKAFSFKLEGVDVRAGEIIFPFSSQGQTEFRLSATLDKGDHPLTGSQVKGMGWVNWARKDMEAQIDVVDVDGRGGLSASAISKNNDMKVKGELNIGNVFSDEKKEDPSTSSVKNLVFGALSSLGIEMGAKFSFETKMDDFRIQNISFAGSVMSD